MKRKYQRPRLTSVTLPGTAALLSGSIPVGGSTDDLEPNESKKYIECITDFADDDAE